MTINSLNNQRNVYGAQNDSSVNKKYGQKGNENVESRASVQREDKLELSEEARKLQPIKNRVAEGFYERPDVIKTAAAKISQQFPAE